MTGMSHQSLFARWPVFAGFFALPVLKRRFATILGVMKFTKMHGIGNDYVYIDGFKEKIADPGDVARKVSDRHFGIGSDGLILILPPHQADDAIARFHV